MKESAKTPAAQTRTKSNLFWVASVMFFLSGGTGLAYQVIWFKRFAHVWGSSSLAFASVGGSFLFGLGLGAYLIGRYADRILQPLRWYGRCELAIGIVALIIPFEIQWLIQNSASFYSQLPDDPLLRYLLQFGITLLVVGPPCVLMGGTLPLLIRELTARDGAIDQATGWLYAVNTFGAAAGCYLTGFHFLPGHGLEWTNNLSAGVNIAIGVLAIVISNASLQRRVVKTVKTSAAAVPSGPNWSLVGLYVAVTLSGLAALILEMTWSRQLALVLGGSSYAYTSTLFVVLVGIATGSLLFHLLLRKVALSPWLSIGVIGALVASCLLGKLLLPQLSVWLAMPVAAEGAPPIPWRTTLWDNARVCVTASIVLEFIPALAMGILFPLFVDLTRAGAARVGRTVGDVYAWNTFGSIAGASLTAVVLFPTIGTNGSVALAAALYVAALLLVLPLRQLSEQLIAAGCMAAGAVVVWGISLYQNPQETNLGMFMYGDQTPYLKDHKALYFAEGASSNVLVSRMGENLNLRVNGKIDASNGIDMRTQLGLAYFPRLFKHDAHDVLVIGFGSGSTSGTSLLFPDTQVTCCEIEPAVFAASEYFAEINHRPQEKTRQFLEERNASLPENERLSEEEIAKQARFKVVFGDGRTTLQGSDQKFDLIISEPSNPWLAGVSNLFTQEFFQAAKSHLKPGGVLAQWIQTYHFTLSDYLMIVRTMRSEFPHCALMSLRSGADTVLLASMEPLLPTAKDLEALQKLIDQSPEIQVDLFKSWDTPDVRVMLLRHNLVEQVMLDRLWNDEPSQRLNTDLNLRLEFEAPLHLFEAIPKAKTAQTGLYARNTPDVRDRWMARLGKAIGLPEGAAEIELAKGLQHDELKEYEPAAKHFENAIAKNPNLAAPYLALANTRIQQLSLPLPKPKPGEPEPKDPRPAMRKEAIVALQTLAERDVGRPELRPDRRNVLNLLADQLFADQQPAEGTKVLEQLIQLHPGEIDLRVQLLNRLIVADQRDEVVRTIRDLAKLNLDKQSIRSLLTTSFQESLPKWQRSGDHAFVVRLLQALLELLPGDEATTSTLHRRLEMLTEDKLKANQAEEAQQLIEPLLETLPNDPVVHGMLAQAALTAHRDAVAAEHFRKALELAPKLSKGSANVLWANNYAWLLATHSDPELRDGATALEWAKQACETYQFERLEMVDTLAASYAELGQFDEAIKYGTQYVDWTESTKQSAETIEAAKKRLELYKARQPFREPPATAG